ncbi:UNVERIFIED_CONTAM: heparan-alpha-glucosaminide N-acetyltransferase domain-containing protein [Kocuria sp. CPCC 205316]|uniref:heparan-alpha-glucosaminide N-acetyltransferase domain-containing protein n=1 Tax=Kocuria TaxID=57493 RepID=UPI0036D89548
MSWTSRTESFAPADATGGAGRSPRWWAGIDAARGLALVGLMSVQILPDHDPGTQAPTWTNLIFSEASAVLFTLLAGVGLALGSGGRFPHRGRWLAADRVGVAVRAVLIAVVGLGIGALMPEDAPADNILIYCGVFFVLAIPFLHLSATALFACAAVFWMVGPLLMPALTDVLPAHSSSHLSWADVVDEPGGTVSQLLVTGTYPALSYMTCLLVGLGVGRVQLRDTGIQVRLLAVGAGLVVLARTADIFGPYAFGGHGRVLTTSGTGADELEVLVRGPDSWPTGTARWLAVTTPPTDTVWAIAAGLGVALLVLGSFMLVSRTSGGWVLRLSAMGAMALSLYTAHLVALSCEVRYDLPVIGFVIHLGAAVLFAVGWQRALGQGPLERVLSAGGDATRRTVLQWHQRT